MMGNMAKEWEGVESGRRDHTKAEGPDGYSAKDIAKFKLALRELHLSETKGYRQETQSGWDPILGHHKLKIATHTNRTFATRVWL